MKEATKNWKKDLGIWEPILKESSSMWLENLLSALDKKEIFGTRKVFIKGITDDSRKVRKGYLFVAVKGLTRDGHDFIDEAIKAGARVLIGEKDLKTPISYIKVVDSREALGQLSSFWYGIPSKKLKVIGVSGTDGKTTTSNLIYWILKTAGHKVGLISTLGAKIGQKSFDTGLHVTNPDPLSLQSLLSRMVNANCDFAVLEVTSHGLAQGRVVGVNFDIGVLTNITHEHIDYHKTYKNYALAKAKLFNTVKVAILDKSDKSYKYIKTVLNPDIKVIDFTASVLSSDEKKAIEGRFPEQYNRLNALASISVAKELKIPDKIIADAINTFPALPGRMEEIKTNKAFKVFVDFAHTPNAMEKVLSSLRKKLERKGRLIIVFGSAGER
ncbi:MAG: UDP-N-acetylmuramoyl-L-alanyl-D-glutamate--2,6-diaminopimelate ligase, partial [Patescibacteria group bacterium]